MIKVMKWTTYEYDHNEIGYIGYRLYHLVVVKIKEKKIIREQQAEINPYTSTHEQHCGVLSFYFKPSINAEKPKQVRHRKV